MGVNLATTHNGFFYCTAFLRMRLLVLYQKTIGSSQQYGLLVSRTTTRPMVHRLDNFGLHTYLAI